MFTAFITQMIGTGHLLDYQAGRELNSKSFNFRSFTPHNTDAWDQAYARFTSVLER